MDVLLLTADPQPHLVLPALDLLPVKVRVAKPDPAAALTPGSSRWLVLLDARHDLRAARELSRSLHDIDTHVVVVVTAGGVAAVGTDWGVSDIVLDTAGPAEVHCRLRLVDARSYPAAGTGIIRLGQLVIDTHTYTAQLHGQPMELTYKEFELLKFLAERPSRVYTREDLVTQVWGYDFYGGTRTVDVHVRRLRVKLAPDHDALIATVRNVGYKLDPPIP